MSTVLSTMANALIEFILSLLRDPDAAAAFDQEPEAALAGAGLGDATYGDVCAVMPLIYDNPNVVQTAGAAVPAGASGPGIQPAVSSATHAVQQSPPDVVRQLQDIIHNNSYVTTNNSTLLDQSVNQNIWAEGDVMQLFDNEATIASGENSVAVGGDVVDDRSQDSSTTIVAGGDAVVDNTIDVSTIDGSYNETLDQSTTTGTGTPAAVTPAEAVVPADAAPTADPVAPVSAAPAAEPVATPAAEPVAAAPEPVAAAPEPLSEPEPYDDQSLGTAPEPEGYDDPMTDDDY